MDLNSIQVFFFLLYFEPFLSIFSISYLLFVSSLACFYRSLIFFNVEQRNVVSFWHDLASKCESSRMAMGLYQPLDNTEESAKEQSIDC